MAGDVVEGQIIGAPRPGVTRNKPKKQKKDIVWNEMIQLQASQGEVESRPATLNLTVMKGKKITGVAFAKGATEPGIDMSTIIPDVPVPMEAILKVQDKKKGWIEKGSIKIQANFVSTQNHSTTRLLNAHMLLATCSWHNTNPAHSLASSLNLTVSLLWFLCTIAGPDRSISAYRRY